jgi:hypothetical protein
MYRYKFNNNNNNKNHVGMMKMNVIKQIRKFNYLREISLGNWLMLEWVVKLMYNSMKRKLGNFIKLGIK